MNKKIIAGASVFLVGVVLVIGLAYGLVYGLNPDLSESDSLSLRVTDDHSGHICCRKLKITGTSNPDEFYQEMMGDYTVFKDYPKLDFTNNPVVKHDLAKHVFPVYTHSMFENDATSSGTKYAYLYFYYNLEPKKNEIECPEGCWIISMYDMTPGNYWYGRKYYYMKKAPSASPPVCPDFLSAKGAKFTNQQGVEDQGLTVECVD